MVAAARNKTMCSNPAKLEQWQNLHCSSTGFFCVLAIEYGHHNLQFISAKKKKKMQTKAEIYKNINDIDDSVYQSDSILILLSRP